MPPSPSRNYKPLIIIIVIILASVGIYLSRSKDETVAWKTHHQNEYALDVQYPPAFHVFDTMNMNNACCVFVLNYEETASTTFDAPGRVKMQIGYYDTTRGPDPFKFGSTTKTTMGKNTVYTGMAGNAPFYLIPRSETEGFGVAFFAPAGEQAAAKKQVEKIVSTITLGKLPTIEIPLNGTSTSATSTKK